MQKDPVVNALFERLLPDDIKALDTIIPDLDHAYAREWCKPTKGTARWRALTLRFCTHFIEESRERTKLSEKIPPKGIHMMQRADTWFVGDFYSSNMVTESLAAANIKYEKGSNYLDFGCSSGSLVRALAAFSPSSNWYGVDPVGDSTQWASENLPLGTFGQSPQSPPLVFEDNYFRGVTAISIWSHFSEKPALDWFEEMARLIMPGGWLFFTTHGVQTIRWAKPRANPETLERIRLGLRQNDYHFENVFGGSEHYGLETQDWGNSYLSPKWLLNNLSDKWDMGFFQEGRNQANQDCYVLKRRWT